MEHSSNDSNKEINNDRQEEEIVCQKSDQSKRRKVDSPEKLRSLDIADSYGIRFSDSLDSSSLFLSEPYHQIPNSSRDPSISDSFNTENMEVEPIYECPICYLNFNLLPELELHVIKCLDNLPNTSSTSTFNSNEPKESKMTCPICSKDLGQLTFTKQQRHVNQCLDSPPQPNCQISPESISKATDFDAENELTSSTFCPSCKLEWKELKSNKTRLNTSKRKLAHLKKCAQINMVSYDQLILTSSVSASATEAKATSPLKKTRGKSKLTNKDLPISQRIISQPIISSTLPPSSPKLTCEKIMVPASIALANSLDDSDDDDFKSPTSKNHSFCIEMSLPKPSKSQLQEEMQDVKLAIILSKHNEDCKLDTKGKAKLKSKVKCDFNENELLDPTRAQKLYLKMWNAETNFTPLSEVEIRDKTNSTLNVNESKIIHIDADNCDSILSSSPQQYKPTKSIWWLASLQLPTSLYD